MLKIYLDWNVISNLKKDENSDILNTIIQYKDYFIFPYTRAHLQDLYQSKVEGNENLFNEDIQRLSYICGNHLLEYNIDVNKPYPYDVSPIVFEKTERYALDCFRSGFDFLNLENLLTSYLGENASKAFTLLLQQIKFPSFQSFVTGQQIDNCLSLLRELFDFNSEILKNKQIEGRILNSLRKTIGEKAMQEINKQEPQNAFKYIDKMLINQVGLTLTDLVVKGLNESNRNNESINFISQYLSLALYNYHRDKNHSFLNIACDALHAYYGSYCDVVVTQDKGMKFKAMALYHNNKQKNSPRIIGMEQLKDFLIDESKKEYDINHIKTYIVPKFGKPKRRIGDNLIYDVIPSPVLGLFDFCSIKKDRDRNPGVIFICNTRRNGFVFYSEISRFLKLFKDNLEENIQSFFQEEVIDKFESRNLQIVQTINFKCIYQSMIITIIADPTSDSLLPAMIVKENPFAPSQV